VLLAVALKECPRLGWKGNSMRKTNVSAWLFLIVTASLVLAASLFTASSAGATDTITVFHKFVGGNDGDDPSWLIQASDGNFYGTTYLGVGTVFQVTPAGQFTTVFRATHNSNSYFYGDFFTSVVEGPDGLLYVIARGSNNNPPPTLFRISKSGSDLLRKGWNGVNPGAILGAPGEWNRCLVLLTHPSFCACLLLLQPRWSKVLLKAAFASPGPLPEVTQ
jgi:hypothetical protein